MEDCQSNCAPTDLHIRLAIGLSAGLLLVMVSGGFLLWLLGCRWSSNRQQKESSKSIMNKYLLDLESQQEDLTLFSYKELLQATNSFSEARRLGDGGFGTVYEGVLKDGRIVAVKKLNCYVQSHKQCILQFMSEITILSQVKHSNLVQLIGCSSDVDHHLLVVFECVCNGTLADHLHGLKAKRKALPWLIRLQIAIQIAEALAFLHSLFIVHRDVKSSNILLDENLHAKLGDFGLSYQLQGTPELKTMTHIANSSPSSPSPGTPGYVDPDYHRTCQLTDKSDVYSFGVVLLELISGMKAMDMTREKQSLASWAVSNIQCGSLQGMIDPNLIRAGEGDEDAVIKMVARVGELSFQCLTVDGEDRPSMREIVASLQQIRSTSKG